MANERTRVVELLGNSRGQSWVETVVMLPVIVALLLGLFYLHDLVTTKIRAIQAARFVAWESTWYAREDNDSPPFSRKREMTLNTSTKLKARLRAVGLDRGLKHADVFKRSLANFKSDVSPGAAPTTFFVPAALGNALGDAFGGGDDSQAFIGNIAGSLSDVISGLAGVAGDAAFFFQGFQAQNTNWETELNESVYTARVVYEFGYTGFFSNFGTVTIVQRASVLSHPYAVKRSNDDSEHSDLLGNPCAFSGDANGHVYKLWLFPQQLPPLQGAGDVFNGLNDVIDVAGDAAKCLISGPGRLLAGLDELVDSGLGFKMPSGTTKEYPELNMPTNSGSSSGSGSGSSLGGCEEGGGGAMGSDTGFGGCP
jgi:hypothetical protein